MAVIRLQTELLALHYIDKHAFIDIVQKWSNQYIYVDPRRQFIYSLVRESKSNSIFSFEISFEEYSFDSALNRVVVEFPTEIDAIMARMLVDVWPE
jgi:hypothetical protein